VALRELSGSLFIDLVAELRALDDPSMPVLFAVDQYNTWEVPSAYSYNNQQLLGKQLCVPHALNFLSAKKAETAAWTMKNGVCIGEWTIQPVQPLKGTEFCWLDVCLQSDVLLFTSLCSLPFPMFLQS
jgi:hypothetical protein